MAGKTSGRTSGIGLPRIVATIFEILAGLSVLIGVAAGFKIGSNDSGDLLTGGLLIIAGGAVTACGFWAVAVVLRWLAAYYALASRQFEAHPVASTGWDASRHSAGVGR